MLATREMGLKRIKELYRVDHVPLLIRPFYLFLSYLVGSAQYFFCHWLIHFTSRIEFSGDDPRKSETPCLWASWHSEVFAFFTAFRRVPRSAVINHPFWYMKSTHVLLKHFGVEKIFLGSTGHGGREAAQHLVEFLKKTGYSSFVTPDGPDGPAKEIKKGILHMAAQTGLPIVPLRIEARPEFRLGGWDRKLIPLPFGKIKVSFGKPIFVNADNFATSMAQLKKELNGKAESLQLQEQS